jgi:hypothetical protein
MCFVTFDKFVRLLSVNDEHVRHFTSEHNAVELVGVFEQFWSERGRDELRIVGQ